MQIDDEVRQQYEKERALLIASQQEEMKKKTNPLFAKMHALSDEEIEDLKRELEKAHQMQRKDLAMKFGIPLEEA